MLMKKSKATAAKKSDPPLLMYPVYVCHSTVPRARSSSTTNFVLCAPDFFFTSFCTFEPAPAMALLLPLSFAGAGAGAEAGAEVEAEAEAEEDAVELVRED